MDMIAKVKRIGMKVSIAYVLIVLSQPVAKSQDLAKTVSAGEKVGTAAIVINKIISPDTTIQMPDAYIPQTAEVRQKITKLPESLVIDQFKCSESIVSMTYNSKVKNFITHYTVKDRSFIKTMLERKHLYFPIYEEALKKYGLPEELKYLSIIESNLNPKAVSPVKAAGLWQFMSVTGKYYDLKQDAYIDERMDPYKATDAACRYLKDLHGMFGDWHLALAAYNCGPGNVRRAIRRSGNKKSFWQIHNFLPAETRAYVPKFIAVNYLMKNAEAYNITTDSLAKFIPADTILINQQINMKMLASHLGVSAEVLQALNPQLKKSIVPAHYKNYSIRIPADKKEYFSFYRHTILASSIRLNPASVTKSTDSIDFYKHRQLASIQTLDTLAIKVQVTQLVKSSWRVSDTYTSKPAEKISKLNILKSMSQSLVKNQ